MKPPATIKELKSFLGKLSYIRRFIPGLAALTAAFTLLLKKGRPYHWNQRCQQAFSQLQQLMTNLPTMCVPTPRKLLKLYLATNNEAMGALIAQEDQKGTEQPIYNDSQILKDAKTHCLRAEKAFHSLIYAAQRLWHFFLAHTVYLMTKSHPIRSLLRCPVLFGRLAQWLLQLSEFEIIPIAPIAGKGQAIADLLAWFTTLMDKIIKRQ